MSQKISLVVVVLVLLAGGVALINARTTNKPNATTQSVAEGSAADKAKDEAAMVKDKADSSMKKTDSAMTKTKYAGEVLAGSSAPYVAFMKADYDAALKTEKTIILDFYANWCPICRAEAPILKSGFDSLTTDKIIGFRVNFNDSDTDADEKALATQFHVPYQHTKVILKDGKEIGRSSDQWDHATFDSELAKYK